MSFENEKVVEIKQCKHCNCIFEITDKDLEFYEKVSPVFAGIRYNIPIPTLCPDCRQQRRLSFRNERNLYKRKCDFSGKDIISIYSPDKPYKVYSQEIWWSDKWNPMDYGRDFDFSRSFFEQFDEMMLKVPRIEKLVMESENCNYNNIMGYSKNCYMCSTTFQSENATYSYWCVESKNCIDVDSVWRFENGYDCLNCNNCQSVLFSENTIDSSDSLFLYDCVGCNNCFLSTNLRNRSYFILNEPYSKEEYKLKIEELQKKGFFYLKNLFKEVKIKSIKKEFTSKNIINSIGDYIFDCRNALNCFNVTDGEDIKYCFDSAVGLKSGMDMSMIGDVVELMYEAHASGYNGYKSAFVNLCWTGKELYYCDYCMYCNNLFGCIGLRNKSYCILNKQYTKEEYEILVPKIIEYMMKTGEWGEFFPSGISPFGYNETVAMEYFPIPVPSIEQTSPQSSPQGEEAEGGKSNNPYIPSPLSRGLGGGFNWSTYQQPFPKVEKIIPSSKLPENILDIPDDILNWAVECEITKKPFRIIKQELEFYRKYNLPIPKRHPDQRHLDRMKLRNPRKLFDRKCDKCHKDMKTTYAPERPEIVYCEKCYEKEVY